MELLIGPALKIADKIAEQIFANHSFKGILKKLEVLKELEAFLDENPKSSMMIKVTEGFLEWKGYTKISYLYLELARYDGQYLTPGMGVPYDMAKILENYVDGTIKDANKLVEKLCGRENKLFAFIIQHAVFYVKNVRGGLKALESCELD